MTQTDIYNRKGLIGAENELKANRWVSVAGDLKNRAICAFEDLTSSSWVRGGRDQTR